MKPAHLTAVGLPLMALTASSCIALDWGFEGTTTSSGGSVTASSTGAGGATSTATSGGGGATGTGGAPSVCVPGTQVSCYTGIPSTENVGACHAGSALCKDDGSGPGTCMGEVTPTQPDCKSSTDEDCNGVLDKDDPACKVTFTGAHLWSKVFPAMGDQLGTSVATDSAGNVVIAGIFQGTVSFGGANLVSAGGNDVFVAKFDPTGAPLWSKRFGGPTDEGQRGVQVGVDGTGNVVLAGQYHTGTDFGSGPLTTTNNNDVFIVGLDPSGNTLWVDTYGATSLSIEAMAVNAAGYVALTGYFDGSININGVALTSAGNGDIFAAKLGPTGTLLWGRAFGDVSSDNGAAIAFTPAGDVFVTGYFNGAVNFGDGLLTSAGSGDIFLTKLGTTGNALWSKRFGDAAFQGYVTLATDSAANVFLLGRLGGTMDFGAGPLTGVDGKDIFVAKLDQNGVPSWSKSFNGTSSLLGAGIAADASGNVVLAGYGSGSIDLGNGALPAAGGNDIVVAKLSASGKSLWSKRFGDATSQQAMDVAVDGSANVLVLSEGLGTIDFGGGPLVGGGGIDTFLAKLAP